MSKLRVFACEECGKVGSYRGARFCSRSCRTTNSNKNDNPAKREAVRSKLSAVAKAKNYKARLSTTDAREKAIENISAALRGRKQSREHVEKRRAGWKAGHQRRGGMSKAHKAQLHAIHQSIRGERHPWWQGGTSTQRMKEYHSEEYRSYRTAVLNRDDYTCQACGKRGGKLEVDHCWVPYAQCKGHLAFLKYHPDNGRVLCWTCHNKTKTWRPDLHQPKTDQLPDHIRQLIAAQIRA